MVVRMSSQEKKSGRVAALINTTGVNTTIGAIAGRPKVPPWLGGEPLLAPRATVTPKLPYALGDQLPARPTIGGSTPKLPLGLED